MTPLLIPVTPGELFDRLTILEIKAARIADPAKVKNVTADLAALQAVRDRSPAVSEALEDVVADLKAVNERLWEVEDALREFEAAGEFGPEFVAAARSVYRLNDDRHRLKRAIDAAFGVTRGEEKSYGGRSVDATAAVRAER